MPLQDIEVGWELRGIVRVLWGFVKELELGASGRGCASRKGAEVLGGTKWGVGGSGNVSPPDL